MELRRLESCIQGVAMDLMARSNPPSPFRPTITIGEPTIASLRRGIAVELSNATLLPASGLKSIAPDVDDTVPF